MKYRDPKTGEVFEDIDKARTKFCTGKCSKCALNDYVSLLNCREYYSDSPVKAARLMGLEVVEDRAGDAAEKVLPRICQVLGVEETPVSKAMEVVIDALREDKTPGSWYYSWQSNIACTIMDNSDVDADTANEIAIKFLDRLCEGKPRFTQEEVAKAAHLHGAWGENARLRRTSSNTLTLEQGEGLWLLPNEWLPSLRPGQAVKLEDVIGGTP